MSTFVLLNDSIRLTAKFSSWNASTDESALQDPNTIVGTIYDEDMVLVSNFTPTHVSTGVYQYVWTPNTLGIFYVEFKGTYADSSEDIVREQFEVSLTSDSTASGVSVTLEEDQFVSFMPELSPIYVDPEEILSVFPDASPIEINEYLAIFSAELDEFLGDEPLNGMALDFVKASTCCALSKIYDISDGADISSFTLGELSVTTRSFPKSKVTRGNASSWCELAAALRIEMLRKWNRAGMRQIVKGCYYTNPIPLRRIDIKEIR